MEKEEVEGELMMKLSCSNVKVVSFGRSEIATFSTKEKEWCPMWMDANSGNPERTRVLVVLSFPVNLPMSSVSIDALSELTENG